MNYNTVCILYHDVHVNTCKQFGMTCSGRGKRSSAVGKSTTTTTTTTAVKKAVRRRRPVQYYNGFGRLVVVAFRHSVGEYVRTEANDDGSRWLCNGFFTTVALKSHEVGRIRSNRVNFTAGNFNNR